jgi:hypothetical protein
VSRTDALIPYLGVYLSDLVFQEDGNADLVAAEQTATDNKEPVMLINWSKRILIYETIRDIMQYQDRQYNLYKVVQVQSVVKESIAQVAKQIRAELLEAATQAQVPDVDALMATSDPLYELSMLREAKVDKKKKKKAVEPDAP